jgi:hypothetical protein
MDALSQTLRVVHLVGAIFINARFTAPWCYQSPSADTAAPFLEPDAERVVIFHLITEGECYVELGDDPPLLLSAGDVVIFPPRVTPIACAPDRDCPRPRVHDWMRCWRAGPGN